MLKVGLTGGIGSGKTTVANYFQELGVYIIDADEIAKQLTNLGEPAYTAIIDKFGGRVLLPNRSLNRQELRKIIFESELDKEWLEQLLHPMIKLKIEEEVLHNFSAYCIVAIPLLIETQSFDLVDRVLVVDTPVEKQIERTLKRDRSNLNTVIKIIESQATRDQRNTRADEIIINDTDLIDLKTKVLELHKKYIELARV